MQTLISQDLNFQKSRCRLKGGLYQCSEMKDSRKLSGRQGILHLVKTVLNQEFTFLPLLFYYLSEFAHGQCKTCHCMAECYCLLSILEPVCCKKQQKKVPDQLLVCGIGDLCTDKNILDESYQLVKHFLDFPLWEYWEYFKYFTLGK